MAKTHSYMPNECKELCKCLQNVSDRYPIYQIFEDWLAMSAIAISNAVDLIQKDEREQQYLEIVKKYSKDEANQLAECLGILVNLLEKEGVTDILGKVFHALNLHNEYHGQFFTPFHICEFMGQAVIVDGGQAGNQVTDAINEKGFFTMCEPCVGSGGLVLGLAKAMEHNKLNYQQQLCVTAIDIDIKCVHMAYLQLSLFGIPAVVIHGNSLTVEQWSVWRTPAYILGFWEMKTRHIGNSYLTEPIQAEKSKKETVTEENSETNNVPPKFDIEYSVNRNGQMSLF